MLPLIPFAAGLLTGAVAVRLLRNEKARAGLDKAQDKLREATISSLSAIENSSAAMRQRLAADQPAAEPPVPEAAAGPERKAPRRKTATPRKPAKKAAGAES